MLGCALFSKHSLENCRWRQSSRRYQLAIKDREYDVGSWNKNSQLYCRVTNLQAGFIRCLLGGFFWAAGPCGVLFYHLAAPWDSAHGGNGPLRDKGVFINSTNYYRFMFVVSEAQQTFPDEGKPLRIPGMLISTRWEGGRKHSLLQSDQSGVDHHQHLWINTGLTAFTTARDLYLTAKHNSLVLLLIYFLINLEFRKALPLFLLFISWQ